MFRVLVVQHVAFEGLGTIADALSDVFELPAGAEVLVSSEATLNQAFRYGASAYGFLFHLEATGDIIRDMVKAGEEELHEIGGDGDQILTETGNHLPRLQQIGSLVWQGWASLL